MKKMIGTALLLTSIASTSTFALTDGAGSSGGGQSQNGVLRDLQDEGVMDCSDASEAVKNLKNWPKVVEAISKNDYMLGRKIEVELAKMSLCFSNQELNNTIVPNQDGVLKPDFIYEQAGIRVAYDDKIEVYTYKNEWEKMDDDNKNFFVLHELSHSVVDKEPSVTYTNRLRYFVNQVYKIYQGADSTPASFERIKKQARIMMPSVLDSFEDGCNNISCLSGLLPQIDESEKQAALNFALGVATYVGGLDRMNFLIKNGADVNAEFDYAMDATIICHGIFSKKYDAVRLLISKGADVNTSCSLFGKGGDYSPLTALVSENYPEEKSTQTLKVLLDSKKLLPKYAEQALETLNAKKPWGNQNSQEMIKMLRKYLGKTSFFNL